MTLRSTRTLAASLALAALWACGPRGSGYTPAENALTVTPGAVISAPNDGYVTPEAQAADERVVSAATGDSNGLQPLPPLAGDGLEDAREDGPEDGLEDSAEAADPTDAVGDELGEDPQAVEPENEASTEEMTEALEDAPGIATAADGDAEEADEVETNEPESGAIEAEAETAGETEETDEVQTPTAATDADADAEADSDAASAAPLAQTADFDWQTLGAQTYAANCAACHQAEGQGLAGAFPPLAGHTPELYNAEGGRVYLILLVLYGLQGEIEVLGTPYNGAMPAWAQLSDEQVAAALNHALTAWGNAEALEDFTPILPDEVAAERDLGLSPAEVRETRPELP